MVVVKLIMMAGNNYFLDSNIIIDLFHGNKAIKQFLIENNPILISVIVLEKLLFGAENAQNQLNTLAKKMIIW